MKYWSQFLKSLDSPGGHILILVGMLIAGHSMSNMELSVASMGALFAILRTGERT